MMLQTKTDRLATEKERQRLEIARDIEAFIAKGGRIDVLLEPGAQGSEALRSIERRSVDLSSTWPGGVESGQ